MPRVLIIYYSLTGNTEKMAKIVAKGVEKEKVEVEVRKVEDVKVDELKDADGIIVGSPTHYGSMASQLKQLFEESRKLQGQLVGKVGAAFASSHWVGGGNETTIMDILRAFLIHGMIVQGEARGDHYGPVALYAPDERSSGQCEILGQRVARLVKKLKEEVK